MLCCTVTTTDPFSTKRKKTPRRSIYYYTKDFVRIYNNKECSGNPFHNVGREVEYYLPKKNGTCFNDVKNLKKLHYNNIYRLLLLRRFDKFFPRELILIIEK